MVILTLAKIIAYIYNNSIGIDIMSSFVHCDLDIFICIISFHSYKTWGVGIIITLRETT